MSLSDIPIWEWIWMTLAAISSIFYFFVLLTIIRAKMRPSNNLLKGPFFTITVIQGIHELLELATTTGLNRLRKYRIISYALEEDNNLVEWEWYWYIFLKNLLYFGHVETAANRLSAVLFTGITTYDKIWVTRNILIMTLCGYVISAALRAAMFNPNFKFTTTISSGTDIFVFDQSAYQFTFESFVDIFMSVFAGLICSLCYIITFCISRKNGFSRMSDQIKKQEKMLLKCGVITFTMMLPTTIRSALELYARLNNEIDFLNFLTKWNILPAEAMCMTQPWVLLLSCKALRIALFQGVSTIEGNSSRIFKSIN